MDTGLGQRAALVCGATGGLGLACARALASEGARVAILGRRGDVARREAAELLSVGAPAAIGLDGDLRDPSMPGRVVEAVRDEFGRLDILVLSFGGPAPVTALASSDEEMEAALELILFPALRFIRLVATEMQQRGWGRIIAIGSSGVIEPIPGLATSNTARAALAALLKTLAGEVAASGVTVNMVLPGRLATERVRQLDEHRAAQENVSVEEAAARTISRIPAGRYGDPMELGRVVAFLASDAASFVTGSLVRVDGGMIAAVG